MKIGIQLLSIVIFLGFQASLSEAKSLSLRSNGSGGHKTHKIYKNYEIGDGKYVPEVNCDLKASGESLDPRRGCTLMDDMIVMGGAPFHPTMALEPSGDIEKFSFGASGFSWYVSRPWPDGVLPLHFAGPHWSEKDKKKVIEGCKAWEKVSAVKCIVKDKPSPLEARYTLTKYLSTDHSNCRSSVGYMAHIRGGFMRLEQKCLIDHHANLMHEFGHALGLLHEHQRADRDQYVQIRRENIRKGYVFAFDKMPMSSKYSTPYDFNSIMHYPLHAFSDEKRNLTIEPLGKVKVSTVAPGKTISPLDALTMSQIYGFLKKSADSEKSGFTLKSLEWEK